MSPEFPFAEWVRVLATSPETYWRYLSVELGFIDWRELREMNENPRTIPHPADGIAEIRFTVGRVDLARVDFRFEVPVTAPAVFPTSAPADPWIVGVEQVLDGNGKLTALGLSRRSRVLRPVSAFLAYELSFHSASFAADAASDVKDERLLRLRGRRIASASRNLHSALEEAADLDLVLQPPGADRSLWRDWAQLTQDAVHERLSAAGEKGFELGQLAGAVVQRLYALEAGIDLAQQPFEHAVQALTVALRATGDSRLERCADGIEAAIVEQEERDGRIRAQYAEGTRYGMLERVYGALSAIDMRRLDEQPISGPPTLEERALERQVIAEPRNIRLRLAWGKLARLRNDPRGRDVLNLSDPLKGGLSSGRQAWCEPLERLGAQHVQFRAGFAYSVEIDVADLIRNAEALFNAAPLTSLRITGVLDDQCEALLQVVGLEQLDHLRVSDLEIDDAGLIRLLARIPNVDTLELNGSRLTDRGRDALRARQPPIGGMCIDGDWLER